MTKKMLIDATHEEETRVAIIDGNRLAEYDYESSSRKPIKGNIYLAKVTRVEPSLQAAFVNFGGNRHGFLPFSEIHPDYFRIPIADREALLAEQEALLAEQEKEFEEEEQEEAQAHGGGDESENGQGALDGDDILDLEDDYVEEIGGAVASLEDLDGAEDDADSARSSIPARSTRIEIKASADEDSFDDSHEDHAVNGNVRGADDHDSLDENDESGENSGDIQGNQSQDGQNQDDQNQQGDDSRRDRGGRGRRGRRGRDNNRRSQFRNRRTEIVGGEEVGEEDRFRFSLRRRYKIQEVIKRGQIMLVQANKEERGNKGAAVGTYLSLPGRYCVLMPNSPRAGGVSRKIANYKDRARMREIMKELEVPKGMSVIVRTAGVTRTKAEIKRDLDYLMRLWDSVRDLTLQSSAPALIYEEADLIKRSIRDLYTRDVEEILVSGENGFKNAKNFMKMMVPSHIKKVQFYEDPQLPLFNRYQIETQIHEIGQPQVRLRSGGYLVINPTEALVSIDVNSGKATKERHIEETALKTNLEAADEVARQLRLRDLGGLIVIDFIDMEDRRNNARVERRLKEALSLDRARVQVGRISSFGLLELSRQRLSPSLTESQYEICKNCNGLGLIRTAEAMSILVLRAIEEEGIRGRAAQIVVHVPNAVALYILNNKRKNLADIETRYGFEAMIHVDENMPGSDYRLEITKSLDADGVIADRAPAVNGFGGEVEGEPQRRHDRNHKGRQEQKRRHVVATDGSEADGDSYDAAADDMDSGDGTPAQDLESAPENESDENREKRRRSRNRRRGGRNRNRADRPQLDSKPSDSQHSEAHVTIATDEVGASLTPSENHGASNDDKKQARPRKQTARSAPATEGSAPVVEIQAPQQTQQPSQPAAIVTPAAKKEPQSSASYEVVSAPVKEKKRGWWNRLVE